MSEIKNPNKWPHGTPDTSRSQGTGFNSAGNPTATEQLAVEGGTAKTLTVVKSNSTPSPA